MIEISIVNDCDVYAITSPSSLYDKTYISLLKRIQANWLHGFRAICECVHVYENVNYLIMHVFFKVTSMTHIKIFSLEKSLP